MWDCKYQPQGGDLQSHMARISWLSAGEASSGPKFKNTCEIAESRNVHRSIWLVSAMVTDMWHMVTGFILCHVLVSMARTNQIDGRTLRDSAISHVPLNFGPEVSWAAPKADSSHVRLQISALGLIIAISHGWSLSEGFCCFFESKTFLFEFCCFEWGLARKL